MYTQVNVGIESAASVATSRPRMLFFLHTAAPIFHQTTSSTGQNYHFTLIYPSKYKSRAIAQVSTLSAPVLKSYTVNAIFKSFFYFLILCSKTFQKHDFFINIFFSFLKKWRENCKYFSTFGWVSKIVMILTVFEQCQKNSSNCMSSALFTFWLWFHE